MRAHLVHPLHVADAWVELGIEEEDARNGLVRLRSGSVVRIGVGVGVGVGIRARARVRVGIRARVRVRVRVGAS